MCRTVGILGVGLLALATGASGDDNKPSKEQPKIVKDTVKGSIHHGSDGSFAREIKRGLWRGEFVDPAEWRQGKRLPGEK